MLVSGGCGGKTQAEGQTLDVSVGLSSMKRKKDERTIDVCFGSSSFRLWGFEKSGTSLVGVCSKVAPLRDKEGSDRA